MGICERVLRKYAGINLYIRALQKRSTAVIMLREMRLDHL